MGAPPPAQFDSATTMVIRGAGKDPKAARAFRDRVRQILMDNDGSDGMLITVDSSGDEFVVTNNNNSHNPNFDARFLEMRRSLEGEIRNVPALGVFLSLIETGMSGSKTRKKTKTTRAKRKK